MVSNLDMLSKEQIEYIHKRLDKFAFDDILELSWTTNNRVNKPVERTRLFVKVVNDDADWFRKLLYVLTWDGSTLEGFKITDDVSASSKFRDIGEDLRKMVANQILCDVKLYPRLRKLKDEEAMLWKL